MELNQNLLFGSRNGADHTPIQMFADSVEYSVGGESAHYQMFIRTAPNSSEVRARTTEIAEYSSTSCKTSPPVVSYECVATSRMFASRVPQAEGNADQQAACHQAQKSDVDVEYYKCDRSS